MKQFCRYHPATIAQWHCQTCNAALCTRCVDVRDRGGYQKGEKLHMCPNCNLPVQWLGVANIIEPFWKHMSRFFMYPFSRNPLILMLILSACSMLPSFIIFLVVFGFTLKYAYSILQATASGSLVPPELSTQTLSENFGPVVKQMGIYIAVFMAIGMAFGALGPAMGILVAIALTLFLPAMIIILVLTGSLFRAINPMMFIDLAVRMGWGYLLMYFFYSILGAAPNLLGKYVFQYFPPFLLVFFVSLIKIYYTFVSYHLMGYVILQYHEKIGYDVDFANFNDGSTQTQEAERAAEDPESRLLRRVHQLVKDGNHQEAQTLIEQETAQTGITDPTLSDRYYTLLKMTGAKEKQIAHASRHLDTVIQNGDRSSAVDMYMECVATDPAFTPSSGALMKIGVWLNEKEKRKEALQTLSRLTKAYPQDPLVPKAYLMAAQIFNEHLLEPERAKKILAGLIQRYPTHDLIPFAEQYLSRIP